MSRMLYQDFNLASLY